MVSLGLGLGLNLSVDLVFWLHVMIPARFDDSGKPAQTILETWTWLMTSKRQARLRVHRPTNFRKRCIIQDGCSRLVSRTTGTEWYDSKQGLEYAFPRPLGPVTVRTQLVI